MARILFVTQTANPLGGVETWLDDLGPWLGQFHDVTLGLVKGRKFHRPDRYLAARPRTPAHVVIEATADTVGARARAIGRAIVEMSADLVVMINVADCFEAVRRLKRDGRLVRLLYPLHAIGTDYLLDVRDFRGIVDYCVGTSRLASRSLIELAQVEADRVGCVPYGVPPPLQRPQVVPHASPRLLYLGRLIQQQKRVLDLVPLVRELDRRGIDYQLGIAGAGPEESHLKNELGPNSRVQFLGVVSRQELYERVYPATTALVLLSEWETGPLVAWEAMRHGAVVVSTRYLGLTAEDRLRHEENALVAAVGDVAGLADGIARLAGDMALQVRLRTAAIEASEASTQLETSLTGWQRAIDRCLEMPVRAEVHRVALPRATGRLDRVAAPFADAIRGALGRRMIQSDSGGEWPHTYRHGDGRRHAMENAVAALDR